MNDNQFREDLLALAIGVVLIGFAIYKLWASVKP